MEISTEKKDPPLRHLPEGLAIEQIRKYIERRDPDMKALYAALAAKDLRTIRQITHKLKGNAALYGLDEFGNAASRAMNAAEGEDWSAMDGFIREMDELLRAARLRYFN